MNDHGKYVNQAIDHLREIQKHAYEQGFHELGYDPLGILKTHIHELRSEFSLLRSAFHTNMLRAFPDKSHEEITAEIDKVLGGKS